MNLPGILLAAAPAAGKGMMWENLLMIGAIIIIFYFFLIRPQMKKTKEQKRFRESIQKGQKIVTIGGIHGKITEVSDTTVIIEIEGGVRVKLEKSAIATNVADQLNEGTK